MDFPASLEVTPYQVFHFAEDTESSSCCWWWRSRPQEPKEYVVDTQNYLHGRQECTVEERIESHRRIELIMRAKFEKDAIDTDVAFERFRAKLTNRSGNVALTHDRLIEIVNAMYALKIEINQPKIDLNHPKIPRRLTDPSPTQRSEVPRRMPRSRTENDLAELAIMKRSEESSRISLREGGDTIDPIGPIPRTRGEEDLRIKGHRDLRAAYGIPTVLGCFDLLYV